MEKILIANICIAFGLPFFIALMSFVTWSNGFKVLGVGYIARLTAVLIVGTWIFYAILEIKGA
ncbi:hypothetical protein [Serratia sp. JSRIV006]|uniref:hypothetical protein n=1 Tax=Serratia sp. JSRIV006 TaxID=2831896 RepID=UPI001CC17B24|nr:hypothetical protein [Serratia sp. JSRIV006]UAN65900.1 hypothetical protein KGP16_27395 [Serratia sp. JSRIV006]